MAASTTFTAKSFLPVLLAVVIFCIGAVQGLSCYVCGQYNDGVGSITPCINSTAHMHLQECRPAQEWCIKYVSEGSTVRDCVPTCTEKESWSARTYCCQENGCNAAPKLKTVSTTLWAFSMPLLWICHSVRG